MLTKQQALDILLDNIKHNRVHRDYDRVVKYAKFLKKIVTGKDMDELLEKFALRETDELFKQRKNLTIHITKPAIAAVTTPLQKLQRVNPVVKEVSYLTEADANKTKAKELLKALETYYSGQPLDVILGGRGVDLQVIDPNAFLLQLFSNFDKRYEKPKPYIVEVSAEQAVDFQYIGGELQYLVVRTSIKYPVKAGTSITYKDGYEYQNYVDNDSWVFTQVNESDYAGLKIGELLNLTIINPKPTGPTTAGFYRFDAERVFMVTSFNQKSGKVPAMRVGCYLDKYTDGRTCVSFIDNAIPFIMKTIKTISEMDLTMSLHAFPQKVVYTPKCQGYGKDPCYNGKDLNGNKCKACKGTGKTQTHTTGQDMIEITLPDPDRLDKAFDLTKMIHYVTLPIDVMKFQKEYTDDLQVKIVRAIYNSERFVTDTTVKTATSDMLDMDSVYDTMQPVGKQYSLMWVYQATIAANYLDLGKDVVIKHQFPKDFKFKTMNMLLGDLKQAKDSSAPPFVMGEIYHDLAIALYQDRPREFMKYKTQQRFDPFEGKAPEQVQFLITGNVCTQYSKVLYAEWKRIFNELEDESKAKTPSVDFYTLEESEQQKMLDAKVEAYIEKLDSEKPIAIPFDATGNPDGSSPGAPGGGAPNPADGGAPPTPPATK